MCLGSINLLQLAFVFKLILLFRMKETLGWQLIYCSPLMDYPVGHIALVSKFGGNTQVISEKMLAISLLDDSVHLWCLDENNEAESNRKIGFYL